MNETKNNSPMHVEDNSSLSTDQLIAKKSRNLEAIFDAVPLGMILVDANFIVQRVNNEIKKILHKDYSEILYRPVGEALCCRTVIVEKRKCGFGGHCGECQLRSNLNFTLETSKPVHEVEFDGKTQFVTGGQLPWFSMSIEPVIVDDKSAVVVCLEDITERKNAEQKLLETMAMKSQFTSTVSHELRTPLTAISEGINIVLDGLAGRLKKKQKHFLSLAKRNVDRLRLLVNDILDFQKFESGTMEFVFLSENVQDVVKEVYETMSLAASKGNLHFTLDVANDLSIAQFDRNRIIQALINLLSNAIKFTPQEGSVALKVSQTDSELIIEVSDTGLGIPEEDIDNIFERFYRVRRHGKEIQGTGLGLAIVKQIISKHQGYITVESQVGKGTKFTITLPTIQPRINSERQDEKVETILDVSS